MTATLLQLRAACAEVSRRASSVRIDHRTLPGYAKRLFPAVAGQAAAPPDSEAELLSGSVEERAAFWLCLDAINFGSGWFPTLRKRPGRSGYFAIAIALRERFELRGAPTANELATIDAAEIATELGQDPDHPLMALFAGAWQELGRQILDRHRGSFAEVISAAGGSAVALIDELALWPCFTDSPRYEDVSVPFLKRAQITAADLHRSGVAAFMDIDQLTIFADNLVPHVLRVDGVLHYDAPLGRRIDAGELLAYGSREEIEIRACALHAVELLTALMTGVTAVAIDQVLWNRGQQTPYRATRRHRTRCTAY
jgi:hypothetical protein